MIPEMFRSFLFILTCICLSEEAAYSQDKQKFLTLDGYVSTVQTAQFDSLSGGFLNDNFIHNRLNFKGYVNEKITFAAEFRNRLFTGDMVNAGKAYSKLISDDEGFMNLSWNLINEQSFFLNTTIDRIWIDYNSGKVEARIGRQRINWGQTLVWNPNDIFNAYSFFDIDYIERPGSDAVRIQYYPGSSSDVEVAVKANYKDQVTAASLYRFNKWGYDIQFLGGLFNSTDIVAGTGWSGAIGSVSFRGEASWFRSARNFSDSSGTGIITIGFDKTFKNNSAAQAQIMYSNNPVKLTDFNTIYSGNLSARSLAFSRFSAFGQFSYPVTPLLNLSVSGMWFPDLNGYFAGPSMDYSLAENIDFSMFWQHFANRNGSHRMRINLVFLRVKISF
jgi:Protein of unknown function (DUF1302)